MQIVIFPGDGIGPEITTATIAVLNSIRDILDLDLSLKIEPVGLSTLESEGTTIPDKIWDELQVADGAILAPLSTYAYPPVEHGGRNLSAELRLKLNLSANIRPSKSINDGGKMQDLVVVRENTEGFYAVRTMHQGSGEFMPDADSAYAIRKITRKATRLVAKTAFALAEERGAKVTAIHKANVLKLSDGLFLDEIRKVARDWPNVELNEMLVDAAASLLVREPHNFDVILTSNMFGDILSNLTAELSGGLGVGPSLNMGNNFAVAQAAHGSAPDIAGQNLANPTALILSAAMLMNWFGRRHAITGEPYVRASMMITRTIENLLLRSNTRTKDLGGALSTTDFTKAVTNYISGQLAAA